MIITVGGNAGSGKTTIGKQLAEKLGYKHYYMGGLRRARAAEMGLTIGEYNKLGETDPKTDFEVDDYQKELGQKEDNFVIEGRTSYFLIPNSVKIFLDANEQIAAERIFKETRQANQRNEGQPQTIADTLTQIQERKQSDSMRYQKYYNVNVFDPSQYDFVLDTSNLTANEAFNQVYTYISQKLANIDKK
ncbi:MAG: cytidylate kinase family protein [Candidatus Falkowbacteria bacterium]